MASSIVASVIDLYNSIPAAHFGGTRPPIYLGSAAQTTSASAQQRPPYVVLYDDGFTPVYDSSFGGIEGGSIRLEIFALKLDDVSGVTVDSITRACRFGGASPAAKAGLDWGNFSLTGYLSKISIKLTKDQRSYAGFDYQSQRVHKCDLVYRVVMGLSAGTSAAATAGGSAMGVLGITYP